jgi:hypothetical protein
MLELVYGKLTVCQMASESQVRRVLQSESTAIHERKQLLHRYLRALISVRKCLVPPKSSVALCGASFRELFHTLSMHCAETQKSIYKKSGPGARGRPSFLARSKALVWYDSATERHWCTVHIHSQ